MNSNIPTGILATDELEKELIYIGDPMCSWCYGFASVKQQLEQQCDERASIRLVVGGLHPGTVDAWNDAYRKFLRDHWIKIGQQTGQPFGLKMLERDDFVYDTEIPCRAAVTVREMEGGLGGLRFFSALQSAFYADGRDITSTEVLADIAVEFDLDRNSFSNLFASQKMKIQTISDFRFARELGATGFPTVVVRDVFDYAYLTKGFQPFEQLEPLVEKWLMHGLD